jgi:crossover junction endodeoxyribonuclease RusA
MTGFDVSFRVFGTPGAQGSKRGWAIKKAGEYTGQVAMSENSAKVSSWRTDVKKAAEEEVGDGWVPWEGPCEIAITFIFKRPKAHYRTGRNAHLLKDDAPFYVTNHSKGDIDKLFRSTFDALTAAGVWKDDALAVRVGPSQKVYGEREGAIIRVTALSEEAGWLDL